jgi:hypothetical protein
MICALFFCLEQITTCKYLILEAMSVPGGYISSQGAQNLATYKYAGVDKSYIGKLLSRCLCCKRNSLTILTIHRVYYVKHHVTYLCVFCRFLFILSHLLHLYSKLHSKALLELVRGQYNSFMVSVSILYNFVASFHDL